MWILPVLGYLGISLGFAFLTLAIASGLYYLSELVEEHTVQAKRLLTRLIYIVVAVQVSLALVDRFPLGLSSLSIASHLVYAGNLRRFPLVRLTDPLFLTSCALVLVNHYLWFKHFSKHADATRHSYSRVTDPYSAKYSDAVPTFTEIASFFGLCIWLVPFALFVSLSAGENVLPSVGNEYATRQGISSVSADIRPSSGTSSGIGNDGGALGRGMGSRFENATLPVKRRARANTGNAGMAKALVSGVRDWVSETGAIMGFWRDENVRSF